MGRRSSKRSKSRKKHRFGFWDALVVQAAVKGGAGVLLSEDFEPGRSD